MDLAIHDDDEDRDGFFPAPLLIFFAVTGLVASIGGQGMMIYVYSWPSSFFF